MTRSYATKDAIVRPKRVYKYVNSTSSEITIDEIGNYFRVTIDIIHFIILPKTELPKLVEVLANIDNPAAQHTEVQSPTPQAGAP